MPDRSLDLTRPHDGRGRHLNKGVLVLGLLIVLVVVIFVIWPGVGRQAKRTTVDPVVRFSRTVKDSEAMKQMKSTWQGEPLNGEAPKSAERPVAVAPASTPPQGDDEEKKRLRAENERYRELLKQVPQAKPDQPKGVVTNPQADAEAKRLEDERKKAAQADRKLVVWKAPKPTDASEHIRQITYPPTDRSLSPGWRIPCITEGPVSNEVPGSFSVRVRQPVYDSPTGTREVIPQESLIVAAPQGQSIFGDSRMGIGIQRLTFPNGSHLKLTSAKGQDQEGHGGFGDQIDRRWGNLFASILLTGVLRSGTSVLAGGYGGDALSRVGANIAGETSTQGQREVRQFLRTEPRLLIRPGYLCTILLEEPLSLPDSIGSSSVRR